MAAKKEDDKKEMTEVVAHEQEKAKTAGKSKKTEAKTAATPFYKNQKFRVILGCLLLLTAIFLLLSIISYLLHWSEDNSLIFRGKETSWWSLISNSELRAENMMGKIGLLFAYTLVTGWFGVASLLLPLYMLVWSARLCVSKSMPLTKISRCFLFLLLWISVANDLIFSGFDSLGFGMGGQVGHFINHFLNQFIGVTGTVFVLIFAFIAFTIIEFNFPIAQMAAWHKKMVARRALREAEANLKMEEEDEDEKHEENADNQPPEQHENSLRELMEHENETVVSVENEEVDEVEMEVQDEDFEDLSDDEQQIPELQNRPIKQGDVELTVTNDPEDPPFDIVTHEDESEEEPDETPHYTINEPYDPTLGYSHYKFPELSLLKDYENNAPEVTREELESNKKRIVETLNNYNVKIDKIRATIGPTVTLYEIVPSAGIRISKIKNLENDIALSLAALGIRIIAPIPGKGTIGIEVPNSNPSIVSMRSVLEDEKFQNSKYALPIAIGKTISNETYVADLAKMPHLLMAGATGQGKSVGLNAIIASLLYKIHPAYLKFVMVDPKKVELALYSKIEQYYLAKLPDAEEAIITDTKKVVRTLNSLVLEMDNRYELMKHAQVKNIKEYNEKFCRRRLLEADGHRFLPYIVLVIDEFADLIMTAGKEVEFPIARLAQLARAIGIHLIIATQRPTVNVITGTIKANFPARIAFRVIQKNDSRTILDAGGADQLIGRGDMLLSTGSELIRLQCAFIDTPEIELLSERISENQGGAGVFHLPQVTDDEIDGGSKKVDDDERDPLFMDAARLIVQSQQGSTSLIQRKLKLGYNRAGRLMDQLEAAGIVGPNEGSKAREVKIGSEMALEQYLKDLFGDIDLY